MSLVTQKLGIGLSLCLLSFSGLLAPGRGTEAATAPATIREQAPLLIEGQPSTVTDGNGAFRFAGLERGTHQLYLAPSSLPTQLRPAPGAPRVAVWINPGQSLVSALIGGGVRFSASYDPDGTVLSGVVFLDKDGDGQRDPGEAGLAGVTVIDPTVHQYFVPFFDDDLWTLFAEINDDDPAIGQCLFISTTSTTLNSVISVTSSSDGTIYYYDHWEDGYDADPLIPGPTTEVGIIDTGVTQIFKDIVTTPRTTDPLLHDGRDRITVFGERATVVRAVYPEAPGELLAGAWEVPAVSDWGRRFVPVIGEDVDVNGAGTDDYDYVGLEIMAAQSDTEIWVNGTLITTTLEAGAALLIDGANDGPGGGGIDSADVITATGPIQVQMLGAACVAPFSARAYTLQPVGAWTNDYWAPVPDFAENDWCDIDLNRRANDDRDTDIYIHNRQPYSITVNVDDGIGTAAPLTVPDHTTVSLMASLGRDLNDRMGAHLYSDAPFWGVSAIDSTSGNSANSGSQHNDWGYSLIPVERLSSQVVMGWSPGNSLVPPNSDPAHNSGNLAFVSALTDTVVYADLYVDAIEDGGVLGSNVFDINGDGDANDFDVFGNPNFDEPRSDDGIRLLAGEVLRVADPNDNDLTGAVIYTRNLAEKIAVAWGQDPCRAEQGSPYLDMGYTVLATPIASLSKQANLAFDGDLSGDVSPGDIITYTIVLHNAGLGPMFNGTLTDTLPYTDTDFIVGSLAVTQPPLLGSVDYFNGESGSWGYTPTATPDGEDPAVWALRLSWPIIGARETVTATLRVRLDRDIPTEVERVGNRVIFCSPETGCVSTQEYATVGRPVLQIDKTDEPDPVRAGDLLTYTVVVSSTGSGSAAGALILDNLPSYLTYQPGTLNLTLPAVATQVLTATVPFTGTFTGKYADDFDLTSTETSDYSGSDGSLTWPADWTEVNDPVGPGPDTGDVRVGSSAGDDLSPPGYLELTDSDGAASGVTRTLDLADFISPTLKFYVSGANNPSGTYEVSLNGNLLLAEQYAGPYERRVLDLSPYAGAPATLGFLAQANLGAGAAYRFDNIFVDEASPLRTGSRTLTYTISVLTYTTQTGVDPVAYDPVANVMTVTNPIRIPAGAQVYLSFQTRVASPLPNGMQLTNSVAVTSTSVVTNPFPLEDDEWTTILSSHALSITKRGSPGTVYLGQWITYTLFWEVGGNEPAPGVVVSDTLQWPYASFVGCDGGLGCAFIPPDRVVWELGDRLPAALGVLYDSGWLTLTARVEGYPPGGVLTNAAVIDDATDTPTDEDEEQTQVINAGFAVVKERLTDSPVDVGDPVNFSIVITNTGALTITYLPLQDTYDPVFLEYEDAVPDPDTASPGALTWNDLTAFLAPNFVLAPGERVSVTARFTAISSTQRTTNTAVSVGARTAAGDLPRTQDDADVVIEPATAIELLYLRAGPKSGGVLVEWVTLLEIDTYGFWLYRSGDTNFNHAVPVAFIPSKGWHGLGAAYKYLDADLAAGVYRYWLVEVENGGKRTTYGPVSAWAGWEEADLPQRVYLPVIRRD